MKNEFLELLPQAPEIDWKTFKPRSMPPPVLLLYLSLPVEKKEQAFYQWLMLQEDE